MILVVVEDLLFRSKISNAAKALGITVGAATTPDAAIERAKADLPKVVILDLDSTRIRPMEVLERLKEDPALAAIPTVGFVSHVNEDTIQDARDAGIGEVVSRGAFVSKLPELLQQYDPQRP